ncbi:sensor histidine kinase [Pseudonocardia spinosispora]|uniref:sensor histidine kinase n=1 Tax=Pseudonocardia spinosispora TaxID=103441 RepID=UPI0003F9CBE0|nr:HAMP domain-containing sensor histidine kinase [Pseudonocardia spinosispora]
MLAVVAAMCLVLVSFVTPLIILVHRDAEREAMATATERAAAVAALAWSLTPRSLPAEAVSGYATTVFRSDGQVLGFPAPRPAALAEASRHCLLQLDAMDDGFEVLLPVAGQTGCQTVVRVFADEGALAGQSGKITLLVVTLAMAFLLMGLLLAERLARRLLYSLKDLTSSAETMAAGDLSARAKMDGSTEVRRAAERLNLLAVRVEQMLDKQAQHVADLVHRVRTPLTSLRLDIDSVPDPDIAERLGEDHDAVSRVLNEVIRAARRTTADGTSPESDLVAVVAERAEFWTPLAEETGRIIVRDLCPGPVRVRAGQAALAAALDALLGNIFAHTPPGVSVRLTVRTRGPDGVLIVDDAGPGFKDEGLIQRGRSQGASTGLGLDIVRQTADDSGGRMRLGVPPGGGARVELILGGAATGGSVGGTSTIAGTRSRAR